MGSVPSLSLEPEFRRTHGSLYKSLADGGLDDVRLRQLLVERRPREWPLVFAVDASTWDRCDAECSPERGFYYSASKHSAGQPIVAGWSYQWICQLDWAFDSWTAPLDMERIPPLTTRPTPPPSRSAVSSDSFPTTGKSRCSSSTLATTRSPSVTTWPTSAVNASPASATTGSFTLTLLLAPTDRQELVDVPLGTDGDTSARIQTTWARASASLVSSDPRYGTVKVKAWHGLHPRVIGRGRWAEHGGAPPIVRGTAIRIEVEHLPKPTSGTKKTLWLFWSGAGEPDLDRCWRAYLRRFDIEHTFRFIKNTMGWTTPSLCTPDQADRWTWLMVAAYTQLRLARRLVDDLRLPWERQTTRGSSPRHEFDGGFGDFVQRSAPQPVHRNRPRPDRDDRKEPENRPEPAIRRSKRLLELGQGFNRKLKSCIDAESDCATRLGGPTAWGTPSAPPPRPKTGTRNHSM